MPANPGMLDPNYPVLRPDLAPDYLALQRRQQLAQALMQTAQQSAQTPADWDSMRVTPRRSMLSNLAPLADAVMGRKAWDSSQQALGDYNQKLFHPGAPQGNGQGNASTPQGGATLQNNPMLLTGDPVTSQMLLSTMGREEYFKAVAGRYAPTDLEKTLRAAGIDPASPQGQAAFRMNIAKGNYIAPIEQRAGSVERDPITNQVIGVNPSTVTGGVNLYDPQGNLMGQRMVPGAAAAIAESQGAETGAKTMNTPQEIHTTGGGTRFAYPSDAIGTPPALRGVIGSQAAQAPGAAPISARGPASAAAGTMVGNGASATTAPGAKPTDAWASLPKLKIGSAVGAPDAFTEGRLKAAGGKDAELSSKYGEESNLADQKMQYNTDAMKLLSQAETGPSSEWLTENRAKLLEWGVPESLVPGDKTVTPTLELNKVLKQSALQGARAIFGSRMTQMEVRLQHEELSPSTSMTKDAISSLIQQDNIKSQYAKQRADDYGKFVEQGGDPLRFESWYSRQFPLTKFAQNLAPQGAALPAGQKASAPSQPGRVPTQTGVSNAKPWEMNWK